MRPELLPRELQIAPEISVIVDLTIVDDGEAPLFGRHRLVPGLGEIENRKPSVRHPAPEVTRGALECAVIVGPTVRERSHGLGEALRISDVGVSRHITEDSTHNECGDPTTEGTAPPTKSRHAVDHRAALGA
jgi:hypothetical protein